MTRHNTDKPVALILGGTSPHIAVVRKLQDMGYYTVLVDYKSSPPAAAVADHHSQISTLDRDAVLKAAQDWNAQAVVNVCLDQPVPVVAWVQEQLGLPCIINSQVAQLVTNKDDMKQALVAAGVPTAGWAMLAQPDDAAALKLDFPVVAKPVAGTGSLGVVFARDAAQLAQVLGHSFEHASGNGVLVEEFIEGLELSVDCIVVEGKVHVLLARERHKTWLADKTESTCHASLSPAELTSQETLSVDQVCSAIAQGFGLENGPMLVQGIVDKTGRFVVLEVAARLGGGPGASRVVALKTGFDYVQASIDQQLGRPVTVALRDSGYFYAANNVYASAGIFAQISGLEDAVNAGLIEEYYVYRTPGDEMPERLSGRSRVTAFVTKSKTRIGLAQKMEQIIPMLDIRDSEDKPVLRADIGLHRSL